MLLACVSTQDGVDGAGARISWFTCWMMVHFAVPLYSLTFPDDDNARQWRWEGREKVRGKKLVIDRGEIDQKVRKKELT